MEMEYAPSTWEEESWIKIPAVLHHCKLEVSSLKLMQLQHKNNANEMS